MQCRLCVKCHLINHTLDQLIILDPAGWQVAATRLPRFRASCPT